VLLSRLLLALLLLELLLLELLLLELLLLELLLLELLLLELLALFFGIWPGEGCCFLKDSISSWDTLVGSGFGREICTLSSSGKSSHTFGLNSVLAMWLTMSWNRRLHPCTCQPVTGKCYGYCASICT